MPQILNQDSSDSAVGSFQIPSECNVWIWRNILLISIPCIPIDGKSQLGYIMTGQWASAE